MIKGAKFGQFKKLMARKKLFLRFNQFKGLKRDMTDNARYLISSEKRKGVVVGTLFVNGGEVNIYKLFSRTRLKPYKGGVIIEDLDLVFEILEGIVKNGKRRGMERGFRGHSFDNKSFENS